MTRFWRIKWFEGYTEERLVVADSEKEALDQIWARAKYGREIRVLDSEEEFDWQEEVDGTINKRSY